MFYRKVKKSTHKENKLLGKKEVLYTTDVHDYNEDGLHLHNIMFCICYLNCFGTNNHSIPFLCQE